MMNENFVKRLNELMTEKGLKNYYQLSAKTKIQYQTIKNWIERDTLPKTDLLIVLADFFDTSTDYILGRVDDFGNSINNNLTPTEATPPISLKDDEAELLKKYRRLSGDDKKVYLNLANDLNGFTAYMRNLIPENDETETIIKEFPHK